MKITFFADCRTLDDLKQTYRKLSKKHHPDAGGSNDAMRQLNVEYDYLKTRLHSHHKEEWKQKQEAENMDIFKEKLDAVLHIPDIEVEICGDWLWLSGNTKEFKDTIKEAGFKWAPKKKNWYWVAL